MTNPKPEKPAANKPQSETEQHIDEEIEDSFPASDPPSYAGGRHGVGVPKRPKEPNDAT
jgi:hypothetical protein